MAFLKKLNLREKREVLYDKTETYYRRLSDKLHYRKIAANGYGCEHTGGLYGIQTIFATYDYEKKVGELTSPCLSNTTGLLTSILTLISKLQEEFEKTNIVQEKKLAEFRKLNKEKQDEILEKEDPEFLEKMAYFTSPRRLFMFYNDIPEEAVNLITKWCENHGFPFAPVVEEKKKSLPLFKEDKPKNHIAFPVPEFLYELYKLYTAFRLYERIAEITKHGDSNAAVLIPAKDFNARMPVFEAKIIGDMTIEECQTHFSELFKERRYSCYIDFSKGKSYTTIIADSVFDAAYYQLAMLLNDCGTRLIKCPLCHTFFEPSHARQKYCDDPSCNPQEAYKEKMRAAQRAKGKAVE